MKKEGKKYLIKESELKEIIREMLLMEVYDPNDYAHLYTSNYKGDVPLPKEFFKGLGNLATGWMSPEFKEKVAQGSGVGDRFLQWILGGLGATAPGTVGPDFLPSYNQMKLPPDQGPNADAHQQLNVNAACQWLRQNAHQKSTHWCAKYVRSALNYGGLGLPHGMKAPWASYYIGILPANGWEKISPTQAGEPGDVVVIDNCYATDKSRHHYRMGHIAMCIGGGQWASDFFQKTPLGLAHPVPPEAVHYFRYKNRV